MFNIKMNFQIPPNLKKWLSLEKIPNLVFSLVPKFVSEYSVACKQYTAFSIYSESLLLH